MWSNGRPKSQKQISHKKHTHLSVGKLVSIQLRRLRLVPGRAPFVANYHLVGLTHFLPGITCAVMEVKIETQTITEDSTLLLAKNIIQSTFYGTSICRGMDGTMQLTGLFCVSGIFSRSTGTLDSQHLAGLPFILRSWAKFPISHWPVRPDGKLVLWQVCVTAELDWWAVGMSPSTELFGSTVKLIVNTVSGALQHIASSVWPCQHKDALLR